MARSFLPHVHNRSQGSSVDKGEAGQALILFVLLIPVLLGMAALAIDLGSYSAERRTLQNAADAIALAAAQELPDQGDAQATALEWADKYGYGGEVSIATSGVSGGNPNPSVRVTISQTHEFAFMRALGISSSQVEASAKAVKTSPGGMGNVVPWAVLESTRDASEPGDSVTLKYDSHGVVTGNFGAIRLDGSGSSVYRDSLEHGSTSVICTTSASCAETSPVCDGNTCQTETGNMVGSTKSGVDYRITNTDALCDSFDEVFEEQPDGTFALNHECNPWVEGSYASLRVIVLPVITSLCNGSCDVSVTGFSLFWLDGYASHNNCTGSDCEIAGRFIAADVTMGGLIGQYDADSLLHYVRLVE